jgi:DNA invertase Pin-like site-specific DNA recombinase
MWEERGITIKKVMIYGQMSGDLDYQLEEMKEFIKEKNWLLVEAIIDFNDSSDGLFELSDRLRNIDIILIYKRDGISDEFSLKLLYEIGRNENVEVIEYHSF